jgi:parvulin-like peptidyl-prolyl isomerase
MKGIIRLLAVSALLLVSVGPARSAERIAAIVNKEVILASDVDEQTREAAARMRLDPGDSTAIKRLRGEVLNQLVEKQVLLTEAQKQGITITDADVKQAVDREIDALKQRIGSEQEYQAALAKERTTEAELRKRYESGVREQLLISRLVGREVQSKTNVSDAEVRAYFDAHRDSIGKRPEELRMAHLLVSFEPDASQIRRAQTRADSLRALVAKGQPFERVAQQHSDDPSARVGGDLGTFERGDMVAEFENVAFALKPMEISQPVRSRFGYHVIQVLQHHAKTDTTAERIHARHIMVQAKPTPEDEERARRRAPGLDPGRSGLRGGRAQVLRRHGDPGLGRRAGPGAGSGAAREPARGPERSSRRRGERAVQARGGLSHLQAARTGAGDRLQVRGHQG